MPTRSGLVEAPSSKLHVQGMDPAKIYALAKAVLEGDDETGRVLAHTLLSDAA